ncbi:MAG: hypothetical protein FD143_2661 [Ignavibacteria bacterium]|nr:MAG: hypothetical protein FD143_2661 [Ignavibacteria bacterium]KAF0156129.1 MAG: hypothetical protein FD188_3020 [Ignavibacteria bacterium]
MIKPYQRVTLSYLFFGIAWIFFSDRVLETFVVSATALTTLQTYKGWFFIAATSVMLYFLTRRMWNKIVEREIEKEAVFISTMRAVQHILNNFLNKMLFFKLVAEEKQALHEEIVAHYDSVINETSKQIKRLSSIKVISPEEIEKAAYDKEPT